MGCTSVQGRATNPRGVLVSTANAAGENVNIGFHLLVNCPNGCAYPVYAQGIARDVLTHRRKLRRSM